MMLRFLSYLILLLCVAPGYLAAQSQRWESLDGPYGPSSQAIVRSAGGTLIVAAATGIFRSENNGGTWSRSDAGVDDRVLGLAPHPDGNLVGRLMRGQIIYSTDDGRSWSTAATDLGRYHILTLEVAPEGALYAGGLNGLIGYPSGILRSTDAGITWDTIGLNSANVSAILADTGGVMIAGVDGYGDIGLTEIHRSTDYGATWTKVADRPEIVYGGSIAALAIDSSGAYWLAQSSGLRRSTDRGITWDSIASPFVYPERGIYNFAVALDGCLMAATTTGPYRSTDNGATWKAANDWPDQVGIWDFSFDESTIFAATDLGVMASTDGGANWNERNRGITTGIQGVAADGAQSIMALTEFGAQFSTDGGTTWQRRPVSPRSTNAVGVSPSGDLFIGYNFIDVTHGTLHRSTDNGIIWTASTPAGAVRLLDFNSVGHLFAVMDRGEIHRSTDNGETWISAAIDNEPYEILAFAFDSTRAGYAATYDGVLRTTDNGISWLATSITDAVNDVAVDPAGTAYAAATSGVYRSTDQGMTWNRMNNTACTSLVAAGVDELFAAPSELGLYRSTDGGTTWIDASTGLPADIVTSLARNRSGAIYAGTERYGIYRWSEGPLSVPQNRNESTGVEVIANETGAIISINSDNRSQTAIAVFNGLGERISTVFSGDIAPGTHLFAWQAGGLSSGIYFISVCRDGKCVTRMIPVTR